jgi:hypothetical protein
MQRAQYLRNIGNTIHKNLPSELKPNARQFQHTNIPQVLHNLSPLKRTGNLSERYSMSSKEEVHMYLKAFFMGESACRATWACALSDWLQAASLPQKHKLNE